MSSSRSRRSLAGRPVLAATSAPGGRDSGGLRLLAAEAAAHAAHLDRDVGMARRPSTRATTMLGLGGVLGGGIDVQVAVLAGDRPGRPGLRDRSAPGRRSSSAPDSAMRRAARAASASPCAMAGWVLDGRTGGRAASAMVSERRQVFVARSSPAAARGAARFGASRRRRRTAPGRDRGPRPSANSGSSPAMGLTSFLPGTSSAVSTATTPGAARTAARSSAADARWARSPQARRRGAAGRAARGCRRCRARPVTCCAALSWRERAG